MNHLIIAFLICVVSFSSGCSSGGQNSNRPDSKAENFNSQGLADFTAGRWDSAISNFTKAIAADSTSAEAYNNRGMVYTSRGRTTGQTDFDLAVTDFGKAISIDPVFSAAYFNRAEIHKEIGLAFNSAGRLDLAIADYSKVLEIHPNDEDAYMERATCHQAKRDVDGTIADFDKLIELRPQNVNAYVERAHAYCNKGDKSRARADEEKAIALGYNYKLLSIERCR